MTDPVQTYTYDGTARVYPLVISGDGWRVSFRSHPTPGVEMTGTLPSREAMLNVFCDSLPHLPVLVPLLVHMTMAEVTKRRERPVQNDGESLDLQCKSYSLLERKHKQESWVKDQQDHYEAGWEAAVRHYFG